MTSEQDTLLLDAGDYDEILITPYVVSTGALKEFRSSEHALEWRDHRPEGFSVPQQGFWLSETTRALSLKIRGGKFRDRPARQPQCLRRHVRRPARR